MPSGGHARSGPPPQPGSAASEKLGWTTLPLEGRGRRRKAPAFPLVGMTEFEDALWTDLWRKPQAVMWERLGLVWQVAAYCRTFAEASMSNATPGLKTAALRMEDELGLSLNGMARLRWRFAEDEVAARKASGGPRAVPAAEVPVRRLRA